MAIGGRLRVEHAQVFPAGAFVVGPVEPVQDFEASTKEHPVQARDKDTGFPVWSVPVLDADPDARKNAKTVVVKVLSMDLPQLPKAPDGMPFIPIEFSGLTVTAYIDDRAGRPRIAWSIRADSMAAPGKPTRAAA